MERAKKHPIASIDVRATIKYVSARILNNYIDFDAIGSRSQELSVNKCNDAEIHLSYSNRQISQYLTSVAGITEMIDVARDASIA